MLRPVESVVEAAGAVSHLGRWTTETQCGHPLLAIASCETIGHRDPCYSYHEMFDRLHLINADQAVVLGLLCETQGAHSEQISGSFSFDTGPGRSTSSGTRSMPVSTLGHPSPQQLQLVEATLGALDNYPAWRMLVAAELGSTCAISRFFLLRGILGPVLDGKDAERAVKAKVKATGSDRTNAQIEFITDALTRRGLRGTSQRDRVQLGQLLKVRNYWAHRTSSTQLDELWDTWEHAGTLRSVAHRILLALGKNYLDRKADILDLT